MNMHKIKKYKVQVILAIFIVISLLNLFENGAHSFLKNIAEKNITFLGLTTEAKILLASVENTHIPFISGSSEELKNSINKAENYILIANIITFLQLMFIILSKSLIIKIILLGLFVGTFLNRYKIISIKLLIFLLALSPGLALFTQGMKLISAESDFDFGEKYSKELKAKITDLKSEQTILMQEHAKNITQIENGENKSIFFKKLQEDFSYDLQKTKINIKGKYTHLRSFIHNGANEMIRKLFIFGTMVLFCLFLMPMLYSMGIYIIYKQLFNERKMTISKSLSSFSNDMHNVVMNPNTVINKIKSTE
jgi:hypothetical protein